MTAGFLQPWEMTPTHQAGGGGNARSPWIPVLGEGMEAKPAAYGTIREVTG